jgi:hypothetical protein
VIEVVCEGSMNIRKRDCGNVRNNLVGRHALVLMPNDNVLHANPVARKAGPTAADAWSFNDSLARRVVCVHSAYRRPH